MMPGQAMVQGANGIMTPVLVNVPTQQAYSVTRYTWTHPTALVEESTGTITFRFTAHSCH
jgi:hypothetical protein